MIKELTGSELEEFRELLNNRQADLLDIKRASAQFAATVELDQSKVGRLTRMDAMQAQEMSIETNRRREIELQRIKTALHRLENGEYGICTGCDENIAIQRLQFDPSTPVCIKCASKSENQGFVS